MIMNAYYVVYTIMIMMIMMMIMMIMVMTMMIMAIYATHRSISDVDRGVVPAARHIDHVPRALHTL